MHTFRRRPFRSVRCRSGGAASTELSADRTAYWNVGCQLCLVAHDSEEKAATTDLVPIQQEVGGDGDMVVNTREVVLIQDLAKDSEIAREIEAADS